MDPLDAIIEPLDHVLDFVEDAVKQNRALETENERLTKRVAEMEPIVTLHKVAATPVKPSIELTKALIKLAAHDTIPSERLTELSIELADRPIASSVMIRMAGSENSKDVEGAGFVNKAASTDNTWETDGWSDLVHGRQVRRQ